MPYSVLSIIWDLDGDTTVARHTASIRAKIRKLKDKGYSVKKVVFLIESIDGVTGQLVETTIIYRLQLIAGKHTAFVRIYDKRLICEFFDPWDDSSSTGVSKRSGATVQQVLIDRPITEDELSMVADFTKGSWPYKFRIVARIYYARVAVSVAKQAEIEARIY